MAKLRRMGAVAVTAALLAGCSDGGGTGADDGATAPVATATDDQTDGAETETETETEADEVASPPEVQGDTAGEEPGVVLLAEPVTFSEAGLELIVDAVRIVSVEELSEIAGEDISEMLEDPNAETMIGIRYTMRNTTDQPVDWYPAGSGSAVVIAGQQAGPSFLGDWGDTLRANAELELNGYYESRVPADEARAAGEFLWDAGTAMDEDFDTIADPELTITYTFEG